MPRSALGWAHALTAPPLFLHIDREGPEPESVVRGLMYKGLLEDRAQYLRHPPAKVAGVKPPLAMRKCLRSRVRVIKVPVRGRGVQTVVQAVSCRWKVVAPHGDTQGAQELHGDTTCATVALAAAADAAVIRCTCALPWQKEEHVRDC